MKEVHVRAKPSVELRCQFKSIPGVSFINMFYDPCTRGQNVSVQLDCLGGVTLSSDAVDALMYDELDDFKKDSNIFLYKTAVQVELFEACKEGIAVLVKMVRASK